MNCNSPFPATVLLTALLALASGCKPESQNQMPEMPPTRVKTVLVARSEVIEKLTLVGSLAADEAVELKSETDGIIQSIHFEEGQQVKAGDLLVQLDESKHAAELGSAKASLAESRANFGRSQDLLDGNLISQREFDVVSSQHHSNEALIALRERRLQDTRIVAPFDGVVGARDVSPGQVISRNTTLTWLIDLDPVKVEFDVAERYLRELELGQRIEVQLAAFPDQFFSGEVYFIAPFVNPDTRSAQIKAKIQNAEGLLKPGMFANLELVIQARDQAIVIPETAISQVLDNDRAMVYVVDSSDVTELRPVKIGLRMPSNVEVVSGLQEGERVIVEGAQKLGPGMKVIQTNVRPEVSE